jgi:hypothetical protein
MAWAPDYASTAELREYATRSTETVDDVQIALAVTAASRAVDRATNRQFGLVAAEERLYTPWYDRRRRRWVVTIDDLMSVVGLVVEVGGVATTDFTLEPRNAAALGRPWTRLVFDLGGAVTPTGAEYEAAITAPWGWTTVPDPVKLGTLLQGSRFFSRKDSPYGVAGSPELGSELRLLAKVDPDVAVILAPYRRGWWAA